MNPPARILVYQGGPFTLTTADRSTRGIDLAVLLLSASLALSVLAMLALHIWIAPDPFVIAFELIVLLCAVFAFLLARGRFRQGPSLTLACASAIVAVASLLAFVASNQMLAGRSLLPYLGLRFALAGALGLIGAWLVLRRRPREAVGSLVRGLAAGAVLVAGVVVALRWGNAGAIGSISPVLLVPLALVAATIGLGLMAASVHFIIRAFEFGNAARSDQR